MTKVLKVKCRISLYILKDKNLTAQKQVKFFKKENSPQLTNLQHQFYQYVLVTEFFESRVFSAFAKLSFLCLEIEGYHYETHTTV